MRTVSWRVPVLFVAVVATVLVVLGEVAVRVFVLGGGSLYQPDPVLGSWHRPGARGSERGECFAERIAINSHGMRDVEWLPARTPGVPRIAVLGDSFMEGLQVDLHELFTQRLMVELSTRLHVPRVEILNFGMSGFGTVQEYLTYRERAAAFSPDLVVLAFFPGNDVTDDSPVLSGDANRPHFRLDDAGRLEPIPFTPYTVRPAVGWLKEHFQLYGWLFKRATRIPALRHVLLHRADVPAPPAAAPRSGVPAGPALSSNEAATDPLETAWRVTEATVRRLRDEVIADGHRFVMVVIPEAGLLRQPALHPADPASADAAGPGALISPAARRLAALCQDASLECVFPERAFTEACPALGTCLDTLFLPCDGHFAPGGHALAARVTAEAIASRGLLAAGG